MYVVTSIKNTSRPVGCKTIPLLCVDFINCFNAKLFWETLPVAPTVRFYGVLCNDVANMLQRHIFQFPPVRDTADCVSSGRLRDVKTIEHFKQSSLKVVACERWSQREVRLHSNLFLWFFSNLYIIYVA